MFADCGQCRYELCNEYGLYVMDEANVETHGFGEALHIRQPILHWTTSMSVLS